jgi:hypothetical protein
MGAEFGVSMLQGFRVHHRRDWREGGTNPCNFLKQGQKLERVIRVHPRESVEKKF